MKHYLFILISLCWSTIALATINMQITPENARRGETIRLTLTQNGPLQSQGNPDLTPLKKDFTLIGTEHSLSYTANNGVATSENQWVVLLIPKKTGTLAIPVIKIGQEYSPLGHVTVLNHSPKRPKDHSVEPSEGNNAATLHSEVDQDTPFINQQIIYTVKLLTNQSLLEAQYQPPHVENALLIPLGEGRRYQTTTNGQEYSVDEQRYAIYPQKSGKLNITPPKLSAVVYNTIPERIQVEGNDIQLMVKPMPATHANNAWLPAKQLSLTEHYDSLETTMKQGKTLVRKITLQAMGLPAELLPTLPFTDSKQYNVYPEKPDANNVLRHQELVGASTVTVTYILNQAGDITLPSIELPWYNTQTGQNEIATLPSRDIKITSKANKHPASSPHLTQPLPVIKQPKVSMMPVETAQTHPYTLLAAVLFAFAWILTMLLWWLFRHRPHKPKLTQRTTRSNLRQACAVNNPEQALAALLAWSHQQWPQTPPLNLSELSTLVRDIEFKQQIILLTRALYAKKDPNIWHGESLWQAVKRYQPSKEESVIKNNPLPPINPDLSVLK